MIGTEFNIRSSVRRLSISDDWTWLCQRERDYCKFTYLLGQVIVVQFAVKEDIKVCIYNTLLKGYTRDSHREDATHTHATQHSETKGALNPLLEDEHNVCASQ